MIQLTIMTEPVAKGRPRVTTINGHAVAYTPRKTKNAEQMIQALIRTEILKFERFPAGMPLKLEAIFYREKPKSASKKVTMPVQRPDTDNYFKLLTDSCNGYLYADDAQITTVHMSKRFCQPGTSPRIELTISEDKCID